MTIAEYQDKLLKYKDVFEGKTIYYLPPHIYKTFYNLCSLNERRTLGNIYKEELIPCLKLDDYFVFECEDAPSFNDQTDGFKELKKLEKEKLDRHKKILQVMREAASQ